MIKSVIDDLLVTLWANARKAGIKPGKFFAADLYLDVAKFCMDPSDLKEVIGEEGSWSKVREPLRRLCQSSKIGTKAFRFALGLVLSKDASSCIQTQLQKLAGVDLTTSVLDQWQVATKEAVGKLASAAELPQHREVKISYRGVDTDQGPYCARGDRADGGRRDQAPAHSGEEDRPALL